MVWLHYVFQFLSSYLLVLITIPLVKRYALQWGLGDKPNGRKAHPATIPHLGGVGITLGIIGSLILSKYLSLGIGEGFLTFFPGVIIIVILGLVDDLRNLKAWQKLIIQIVASIVLVLLGTRLLFGLPYLDGSLLISAILSIAFLVGVSNSINLIDGHDGLAAGICFISAGALAVISLPSSQSAFLVSLSIAGSCAAFLVFNFPPSKIFMGDTGSMFLGIMLAVAACWLSKMEQSMNTIVAIGFIVGVPTLDTFLAVTRRLAFRAPVFKADYLHVHHVLASSGLSKRQTIVVLYFCQAALALMGIFVAKGHFSPMLLGVAFLIFLFSFFLRMMFSLKRLETLPARGVIQEVIPTLHEAAK